MSDKSLKLIKVQIYKDIKLKEYKVIKDVCQTKKLKERKKMTMRIFE